ncbi:MAG TPA: DUF308 domain-containing protein [Candidatus Limnocylindrales bacterium]|jgi:uncharacterized membrane protein HdeD (DUF308 family)|nr:DUF308 domain-containing protein [Candidatus Limnocylindrales bacterium]
MTQPTGSSGYSQQVMSAASQNMPWRKDVAWWVVLIQGIVLTALGVFVLTSQESAANVIILVAAVLLIADGVMGALAAMRGRVSGQAGTLNAINAGIGIIVGALVLLGRLIPFLDIPTAAIIVALGLIVSGAISLVIVLFMRPEGTPLRMLRLVGPLVWIVIGVLALLTLSEDSNFNAVQIIGILSLIVGVILLVLAFVRFRAGRAPTVPA